MSVGQKRTLSCFPVPIAFVGGGLIPNHPAWAFVVLILALAVDVLSYAALISGPRT